MANLNGTFEDASGNLILNTPHSYAYIETGTTATKAYAKGDLMVFKNQLCQATTAISTGTTLSLNSNVVSTSVANQLSNINVYVGTDNKLHFVDHAGADSVLPFSSGKDKLIAFHVANYTGFCTVPYYPVKGIPRVGIISSTTQNTGSFTSSSYPSISFTRATSSGIYEYTFTMKTAGYYKVAYGGSRAGAYWQYFNVDDTVSMIMSPSSSDVMIYANSDLTMDNP